jgi:hypothetical protein
VINAPRKRGRPSKADLALRAASAARTDEQILADLEERFSILSILTKGVVHRNVRALTITGAPGVGKTYTVESILHDAKEMQNINYEIVRGTLSAINLYMLAYKYRNEGDVIVLDDADSIFHDESALNILKGMCDSSATRRISYMKEAWQLDEADIPKTFEFSGSIVFISNLDFQRFVDEGKNKYAQHFEAIMSRSMYLDLRLHTRAELGVWVEHVAKNKHIFAREGLTEEQGEQVLSFLRKYRDRLRELSIRTLLKTSQLVKTDENWERLARVILVKGRNP